MSTGWNYQVRARLRADLDERLLADLEGLIGNAGGGPDALALPRSRHPLPVYLPYAFAMPLEDDTFLAGPAFGPGFAYDGTRFEGLSGARIDGGLLRLGVRAVGLEREVTDGLGADGIDLAPSRLSALVDFLSRVTDGPSGEVLGRINNDYHTFGHPLLRCRDGRVRLLHTMGLPGPGRHAVPLPELIPHFAVEVRDEAVADLDEDALARWLAASDDAFA